LTSTQTTEAIKTTFSTVITNTNRASTTTTPTATTTTTTILSISTNKQETTTPPLSTTTKVGGKKNDNDPSNKTLIIALATAIPGLFIVGAIGIIIWIKTSTSAGGVLGRGTHPFLNIGQHNESSTLVEMNSLVNDRTF
jgi:hypothetical protein